MNIKKSAAESHRLLVDVYWNHTLSETTCRDWFRCFECKDFDVQGQRAPWSAEKVCRWRIGGITERGFTADAGLSEILHFDESAVSKRLKSMGMIQKVGKWIPYELQE